jgi:hypothetical protein
MKIGLISTILALSTSPIVHAGEYYNNFKSGNANGWTSYDGAWSVGSQSYNIAANSYGGKSVVSGSQFSNLVYEADIVMSPGSWETGMIFRANTFGTGDANYYGYAAALDQSGKVILIRGPGYNVIAQSAMTVSPNKSYRVQVWAIGSRIRIFVDGGLKIDLDDATYASGSIGLMSYSSAASFDNILASTETQNARRDDFNDGNDIGWVKYDGPSSFAMTNGKYISSLSGGPKSIFSNTDAMDFIYQADVGLEQSNGDAGLIFRVSNPKVGPDQFSGYYFGISTGAGAFMARGPGLTKIANGGGSFSVGQTYHLKVVTMGSRLQGYVNETLVVDVTDNTYNLGLAGVTSYGVSASFENIAVSQNVAGGLAKRSTSSVGTFGTPADWNVTTWWNPSFADMKSEAVALQNAFRNNAFGWNYTFTEVGGPAFTFSNFNSGVVRKNSDLVYVASHGNDGFFKDYNSNDIFLRGGYGAKSAIFSDKNKFICLSGCACLY